MTILATLFGRGEKRHRAVGRGGAELHALESLEPRVLLSSAPVALALPDLDLYVWQADAVSQNLTPGGADAGDPAGGASGTGTVISDVPAYYWYRGCGPTSAGMVIGYWDGHGYSDLVVGDAQAQNTNVNTMIASPEHYADYVAPVDNTGTGILADKSSTGGAHENNSVADWMKTSWSARANYYGWSRYSDMDDGLEGYARSMGYADADAWNETWGAFTWSDLVGEIDAGRPMLFLVDTDGNGGTDHIITAIGYDATTNQYAAHNTWDYSTHWYSFAQISSGQPWGIYGATFFNPGTADQPTPDTAAPTAQVSAANVTELGTATYTFTVTFSDNEAVDVSTFDNSDVRVTGPNGFTQTASFLGVDVNSDGTPRTATYRITTPGGTWDHTDNGTYTIALLPNAVTDASGNFASAETLGQFTVGIVPPDTVAPTAQVSAANVTEPGTATYTFTVTFSDNEAVDVSTLDNGDVRVIGQLGFIQTAEFLGVDINNDGAVRTATYRITTLGGTWDYTDNGAYTISLLPNAVSDTNGNFTSDQTIGYFIVDIAEPDILNAYDREISYYDGSTTVRVTNNSTDDTNPQISGNIVVWQGYDGNDYEIFAYDGATTTQITNNDYDDMSPYVSGTNVVWYGFDGHDYEIYLHVLGGATTQLTDNETDDCGPRVSGDNVVWYGYDGSDYEIYFYDGSAVQQVTHNTKQDRYPEISGTNVAWTRTGGGDEIFFWDGTTTTRITTNAYHDRQPQVSGSNVVWVGIVSATNYDVFLWDGATTRQLSTSDSFDLNPVISGDIVAWQGYDGASYQIYVYDGSTVQQVTNDSKQHRYPEISGTNVVWTRTGGGDEIFSWNGAATTRITTNAHHDRWPQASGTNAVWTIQMPTAPDDESVTVVVDNLQFPEFTKTGTWSEFSAIDEYNGSSRYTRNTGATATWAPDLPTAGNYEVFTWWSAALSNGSHADLDSSAEYTINHAGTSDLVTLDQDVNSGSWVSLGVFYFAADGTGSVTLACDLAGQPGNPATVADAVKWVLQT